MSKQFTGQNFTYLTLGFTGCVVFPSLIDIATPCPGSQLGIIDPATEIRTYVMP